MKTSLGNSIFHHIFRERTGSAATYVGGIGLKPIEDYVILLILHSSGSRFVATSLVIEFLVPYKFQIFIPTNITIGFLNNLNNFISE